MRYGILLIGFEYKRSKKWNTLPGIPVDLYQVYRYFSSISRNILVFTDVNKDYKTTVLKKAILDGYVDSNLLSFIEDTKEKKQHELYISEKKNGYRMNNFDKVIKGFVTGLDKLILYYTGHAKGGNIILPDNTQVALDYIREILTLTNPDCQILSILDCCQSDGLSLPYIWSDGIYRLNSLNFVPQKIICLSSSMLHQDSTATRSGSLFTRVLFGYLEKQRGKIITIGEILDIDEIPIIYSSYPHLKRLWNWVTTESNNIDIYIDETIMTITLENSHATMEQSATMKDYLRYHQHGRYDSIY